MEDIQKPTETPLETPAMHMGWKEVFSNYMFLSDLTYMVINQPSYSMRETDLKYEVYMRTKNFANVTGVVSGIGFMGTFMRYCFKSKHYLRKMAVGCLYLYALRHVITLGTHLGILLSLKKTTNKLLEIDERSPSHRIMHKYCEKIQKGEGGLNMSKVYLDFYNGQSQPIAALENEFIMKESYVQNDFFIKNRNKYLIKKDQPESERKKYQVFDDDMYGQESSVLDCFLTRYFYIQWIKLKQKFVR
jgi:hypothetical protein